MARKFLVLIAVLAGLVILGAILWRLFADDMIRTAFVPTSPYGRRPFLQRRIMQRLQAGLRVPTWPGTRGCGPRPDFGQRPSRLRPCFS